MGLKADDVYGQILEMFDELNEGLDRADKERADLKASQEAIKARQDSQPTSEAINSAMSERIGDLRSAILSDLHRLNAENKAGFRRELDEALDEKLPAMIAAEIGKREATKRELHEARWAKIKSRAQTIVAVIAVVTAVWALLDKFA